MVADPHAAGQTPVPLADAVARAQLASWGTRAVALSIDALLVAAVGFVVGFASVRIAGDSDTHAFFGVLYYAVALPFGLAYAPLLLRRGGARNGQTLGKQAMRIRVVRECGEPVTLRIGLLREVVGRQIPIVITYGLYAVLDYLWPLRDPASQCIHDKLVRTRVVRVAAAPATSPPLPAADAAPIRGWLPPRAGAS